MSTNGLKGLEISRFECILGPTIQVTALLAANLGMNFQRQFSVDVAATTEVYTGEDIHLVLIIVIVFLANK